MDQLGRGPALGIAVVVGALVLEGLEVVGEMARIAVYMRINERANGHLEFRVAGGRLGDGSA